MDPETLERKIKECKRCDLWRNATNKVTWEHRGDGKIFFVGEAPGYWEDLRGKPFVGKGGKLLREYISKLGIEHYHITNVVKCRPPSNRTPTLQEIRLCGEYLLREIEIFRPKLIVALGNTALKFFNLYFGKKFGGITRECCKTYKIESLYCNCILIPCFHPAAVLRNPQRKREMDICFERIKEVILQLSL